MPAYAGIYPRTGTSDAHSPKPRARTTLTTGLHQQKHRRDDPSGGGFHFLSSEFAHRYRYSHGCALRAITSSNLSRPASKIH